MGIETISRVASYGETLYTATKEAVSKPAASRNLPLFLTPPHPAKLTGDNGDIWELALTKSLQHLS